MLKPKDKKLKEKLGRIGKIWVKRPSMDVRTSSGVRLGGEYMTLDEIRQRQRWAELLEKVRIKKETGNATPTRRKTKDLHR